MSKRIGSELPDAVFELLNGEDLERHFRKAMLFITLDEAGWPYAAMLSPLEVVALNRGSIQIGIWDGSTTVKNVKSDEKVALMVVDYDLVYYIQGTAAVAPLEQIPGMVKVDFAIHSVLEDRAREYEGDAHVTSGITFDNPHIDAAYLDRARSLLASLKG